jgi:hypothetical protein
LLAIFQELHQIQGFIDFDRGKFGLDLSRLVESYVKTIEVCDLEKRLQVLEASLAEEKVQ